MAFENLVQKALYLGIGLASYAGEKAGVKFTEWSAQTQKTIDELVARGEMTAEEARNLVDSLLNQPTPGTSPQDSSSTSTDPDSRTPRPIEILSDTDSNESTPSSDPEDSEIARLRQQAQTLRDQVKNLRQDL